METNSNTYNCNYVIDKEEAQIIIDEFGKLSIVMKQEDKIRQLEDRISCLENMIRELIEEIRGRR